MNSRIGNLGKDQHTLMMEQRMVETGQPLSYWSFPNRSTLALILLGIVWISACPSTLAQPPSQDDTHNTASQTNDSSLTRLRISWNFQRADDRDRDGWPDQWRRRAGRQYPKYLPIEIAPNDPEVSRAALLAAHRLGILYKAFEKKKLPSQIFLEGIPPEIDHWMDQWVVNRSLEIRLDGGAAVAFSPVFPLDPRFTYGLELISRTNNVLGHRAWAELDLLDAKMQSIRTLTTDTISGTVPWTQLAAYPSPDPIETLRYGIVRLRLEPEGTEYFTGSANFDNIRVWQMPLIRLNTDRAMGIYKPGESISVHFRASGLAAEDQHVHFELIDYDGTILAKSLQPLSYDAESNPNRNTVDNRIASDISRVKSASKNVADESQDTKSFSTSTSTTTVNASQTANGNQRYDDQADGTSEAKKYISTKASSPANSLKTSAELFENAVLTGRASWNLPVNQPGHYRVRAHFGQKGNKLFDRVTEFVVLSPLPTEKSSSFGVVLKSTDEICPEAELPTLLKEFHLGWAKLPVWFDGTNLQRADQLSWLLERLESLSIRTVGVIDQPPASARNQYDGIGPIPAATVFQDPEVWQPLLDPVIMRLALRTRWFQLGSDADQSFIALAKMPDIFDAVRQRLNSYSRDISLGVCWEWLEGFPTAEQRTWDQVNYSSKVSLTDEELTRYVNTVDRSQGGLWISIDPIPANKYNLLDRVRDLTQRMITVRRLNIEAAFISNAVDNQRGLISTRGEPTVLLSPYRTLSAYIGAAEYAGALQMPEKSTNHIFFRNGQALAVVWNDKSAVETLYLGDNVTATDLWGRRHDVSETVVDGQKVQSIKVGPWPVVVSGLDPEVVRVRLSFAFTNSQLNTTIGKPQDAEMSFDGGFAQVSKGRIMLKLPSLIEGLPPTTSFMLRPGEETKIVMPVYLRQDASAGRHMAQVDIQLDGPRELKFTVFREITVGVGDIHVEHSTIIDSQGRLIITQDIINDSKLDVNFDAMMFAPGRARERVQISNIPPGRTVRQFIINDAADLAGQTSWIRYELIGRGQVLNYRVAIDP